MIIHNVYMPGSPWESDMIRVSKAYYYVEYEIKISVADFRNDLKKRASKYRINSVTRHDFLKDSAQYFMHDGYSRKAIPRPKQFYFVVPKNLLADVFVPPHCGVIEFNDETRYAFGMEVIRTAPNLKNISKLEISDMFNLGMKASYKLRAADIPDA